MAPKRSRKRGEREQLLGNAHIPAPDYAMFDVVCSEAAQVLGLNAKEVRDIYVKFIDCSLKSALPEQNPGSLSDNQLLYPRRIIQIPGVASLEITENSLRHWRRIQKAIEHNKQNR
jgi:hypothetical protein